MPTRSPEELMAEAERELSGSSFEPRAHLASGAFGDVFVVFHKFLRTELVLKLLKAEFRAQAEAVERLKIEGRILTRLSHRNLIKINNCDWSVSGRPYLVTEKLEGETLLDRLKRTGPLDLATALDLGIQMLDGLQAVHDAKLVHRDIKPANLFIARQAERDVLKILDFGIAKILDPALGADLGKHIPTADGTMLGTPAYLSPEQICSRPIDPRTDLYAAGCVLYKMIAGRPPFVESTVEQLVVAHVAHLPDPISKHAGRHLSGALEHVIAKSLAKRPEDRHESAAAFAEALRVAQKSSHQITTDPLPPMPADAVLPTGFAVLGSADPEEGTIYATGGIKRGGTEEMPVAADPAYASTEEMLVAGQRPEAQSQEVRSPRSTLILLALAVFALSVVIGVLVSLLVR